MARLILPTMIVLLILVHKQATHGQSENPPAVLATTDEENARAEGVITSFLENRDAFRRYSCAMFVEKTVENVKDTARSSSAADWYFQSADRDQELRRHDELVMSQGIGSDYLVEIRDVSRSLFVSEDEVVQIANSGKPTVVQVRNAKSEDWRDLSVQSVFDPWELPFSGVLCIASNSGQNMVFPKKDALTRVLKRYRVTKFEETVSGVAIEYQSAPNHPIFDRILFDRRQGMMPVRLERVTRRPGRSGTIETIVVKWKTDGRRWYPDKLDARMNLGRPKQPSSIWTYQIQFFWVFDENVPEFIFATTHPETRSVLELKEGILENGINRLAP